jgi:hypothetical protein
MTVQIDVRPETAAKFQAAATALNLSLQEYLDRIASEIVLVSSGQDSQSNGQQAPTPNELGKDFIGKIDSSVPDPFAKPHKTAFGELLVEKHRKQELRLPGR